ncbi:LuxR C-terminal-related transcriptional regulator [Streptomyces sp. NPDC002520]
MNIVVAGGPALVRAALIKVIETDSSLSVAGQAADVDQLRGLLMHIDSDLVLLDRSLHGTDLDFRALVSWTTRHAKAVVFGRCHVEEAGSYLDAGAAGVLADEITAAQLTEALRTVARGGLVVVLSAVPDPAKKPPRPLEHELARRFSAREYEILTMLAGGQDAAAIARTLRLRPSTVKTHIAHMLGKTGTHQRAELIALAYKSGIVTPRRGLLGQLHGLAGTTGMPHETGLVESGELRAG